jgi:hypothetical protein
MLLPTSPAALAAFDAGVLLNELRWNLMHDAVVGDPEHRQAVGQAVELFGRLFPRLVSEIEPTRVHQAFSQLRDSLEAWNSVQGSEEFADAWDAAFRILRRKYDGPCLIAALHPGGPTGAEVKNALEEVVGEAQHRFDAIKETLTDLFPAGPLLVLFQVAEFLDRVSRPPELLEHLVRLMPVDSGSQPRTNDDTATSFGFGAHGLATVECRIRTVSCEPGQVEASSSWAVEADMLLAQLELPSDLQSRFANMPRTDWFERSRRFIENLQSHLRPPVVPNWIGRSGDQWIGELHFDGEVITHVRSGAPNRISILDAFQKAGWPAVLPSPFRPGSPKLHQTVNDMKRSIKGIDFWVESDFIYWRRR